MFGKTGKEDESRGAGEPRTAPQLTTELKRLLNSKDITATALRPVVNSLEAVYNDLDRIPSDVPQIEVDVANTRRGILLALSDSRLLRFGIRSPLAYPEEPGPPADPGKPPSIIIHDSY